MDIGRRSLVLLFAGFVFGCSSDSQMPPGEIPDIAKWTQVGAELTDVLTVEPADCPLAFDDLADKRQILLGKIAFRSPYLLGGQATRQRFSCDACHTNGDINRHFFIEGLSGAPGSADVSNFHFSKTLGDGVFNPKPIPSLRTLDKAVGAQALQAREAFILRLIEKEFSGAPPPKPIKRALLRYVDRLGAQPCTGVQKGMQMLDARLAYIGDITQLLTGEPALAEETQGFVRASLRSELGQLYRRFPNNDLLQQGLKDFSTDIKENAQNLDTWPMLREQMRQAYSGSLFDPQALMLPDG